MKVQEMGFLGFIFIMFLFAINCQADGNMFLINCGSSSTLNVDGRKWVGDLAPRNNVTLSSPGIEASTTVPNSDPNYGPLYNTARIMTETMNYTFTGVQGNCFLRLHFCPFPVEKYDFNRSLFSVVANGLSLVSEFNIPGEILRKKGNLKGSGAVLNVSSSLVKEYFVAIEGNVLVIEFIPSKGSFGIVNAIEVIPVTDKLFVDSVVKVGDNGVNSSIDLSKRGIETMYRLDVGGSQTSPDMDSKYWRSWEMDSSYMINPDAGSEIRNRSNITYASPDETSIAPLSVYEAARTLSNADVLEKSFNMSWKLVVDPEFEYLIRLHFCELLYNKENQRNFKIYINNKTAASNVDIFARAGGMNKAYHEDYFDVMPSKSNTLWVQLGPDASASAAGTDALLSGLEVFKLSQDGNLAHIQEYGNLKGKKSSKSLLLWIGVVACIAFISVFIVVMLFVIRSKRKSSNKHAGAKKSSDWQIVARTGKRFTLAELKSATNNFDESFVIGVGGFGKVFKGKLEDGTFIAAKRANPQSQQGLVEFETEIEMLSKLRHRHLVSMIGFCDEQKEMILVYEYMANGTLRSHLFGSDLPPLSWKQRLEACIGSARGLHYLHTGSERGIIHRDVKSTNILLDEDFVAKMADFGLSKAGPSLDHTHVSTAVKGSFGYLDPEYYRLQQLTEKSDVYSFGVVLFEVVCARPVINPSLPRDQINLAEWAMQWQQKKSLESIIDPWLKGKYCPESFIKYAEIAEKCLADEGKSRPTMGEVLWHLEYILQIHELWLQNQTNTGETCISINQVLKTIDEKEPINSDKDIERDSAPLDSKEHHHVAVIEDFSQMVNMQGR